MQEMAGKAFTIASTRLISIVSKPIKIVVVVVVIVLFFFLLNIGVQYWGNNWV